MEVVLKIIIGAIIVSALSIISSSFENKYHIYYLGVLAGLIITHINSL